MKDQLGQLVERALAHSKADDCIVIGWHHSTANLRWANNTSTTNGISESSQLNVISIIDESVGVLGKSYFPEQSLESIVRESEAACKGKPRAEDYIWLVGGTSDGLEWNEPLARTGIEVFAGLAADLAELFKAARSSGLALFGYAEHTVSTIYLATSSGVRKRHVHAEGKFELNGKTQDFTRSSWVGKVTKDFSDVSAADAFTTLEKKLEWSKKTIDLDPGRYEVILEPSCVADMLIYAYWTSTARDAEEGRTVFGKPGGGSRIGEKLYAESVNLYSDPHEPGMEVPPFGLTTASSSFASIFDNGLNKSRTTWADSGVLKNLIRPRFWAAKTGHEPVQYVNNLVMQGQDRSLDEIIGSTKRALLVTCFWYIRAVDPQTLLLTGLTRDGVFLISDGEIAGAVNNFRYNMSPVAMLAQTTEVGRSELTLPREWGDYFTFAKMPPLRVADFQMSSVSQAT